MPAPLHGQIVVSSSSQPLAASAPAVTVFTIKAPATNGHPVFIGAAGVTTGNGHQLDPGDSLDYQRETQNGQPRLELRPSDFYVVGTGPDVVTWLGSPLT